MAQASNNKVGRVEFDDGDKLFKTRDQVERVLPAAAMADFEARFVCPDGDSARIVLTNWLSRDGGRTWEFAGQAVREPSPWGLDPDGKPAQGCGLSYLAKSGNEVVKLPDGTLLRTDVDLSKQVTGKVVHRVAVEEPE